MGTFSDMKAWHNRLRKVSEQEIPIDMLPKETTTFLTTIGLPDITETMELLGMKFDIEGFIVTYVGEIPYVIVGTLRNCPIGLRSTDGSVHLVLNLPEDVPAQFVNTNLEALLRSISLLDEYLPQVEIEREKMYISDTQWTESEWLT